MQSNILPHKDLRAQARIRRLPYVLESCKKGDVEEFLSKGWTIHRHNKTSVRMSKQKDHGDELEDRVWMLFYQMGFGWLSSAGGAVISSGTTTNQLDVVAVDAEVAIAVECKSLSQPGRRPNFQGELGKFTLLRESFTSQARDLPGSTEHRQVAFVMFLRNAALSDRDRERAKAANVAVFDSADLEYYEQLTNHVGAAARYQFLADVMADRRIPGLSLTVPAIKSKMGGHTCYTFSISPEYLQKIAYVSHRAKGKASDVNAYQRMISKSRMASIRSYIEEESNIFPTNIVLSFDKPQQFERSKQEENSSDTLGWLRLRPHYKSVWVIDGQHRLFAYSGTDRIHTSRLSILAFENLSPDLQAQLFIDINGEQKAVKKALLQELYSELHWNSDDPSSRIKAVVAKAIQSLDKDISSPFFGKIKSAEGVGGSNRSIYFGNLYSALNQPEFYLRKVRKGKEENRGAFWSSDNDAMLRRTTQVISAWFNEIVATNQDWWDLGTAPGGGIAMNDSVTAIIMLLRSVMEHLEQNGKQLFALEDDELINELLPYSSSVSSYLSGLNLEDRGRYRALRGVQGRTTRMRRFQQHLSDQFTQFKPSGLERFVAEEEKQTNAKSHELITYIETTLQTNIIALLKSEYGEAVNEWWVTGVPEKARIQATSLAEKGGYSRGGSEHYLNLIDYREILRSSNNWKFLGNIFGMGSPNASRDQRTKWLVTVNEIRNITMHASSGQTVSLEQLDELEQIAAVLRERVDILE